MYIRVSGPVDAALAVTDVQTDYSHALNPLAGSADVSFVVENRGNVRLGGTASVGIAGPFGLGERTVALPDLPELLPGQRVTIFTTLADVPALFLDRTTVRLTPTGAADVTSVATSSGKDMFFAPPITVVLVLLCMLFGLLARRSYRRHRDNASGALVGDAAATMPERELQPT